MNVSMILAVLATVIFSYFIGAIPSAVVIGTKFFGVDVRKAGSGNSGTTNVLRTMGWFPALIVFACDAAKGAVSVLAARLFVSLFLGDVPINTVQIFQFSAAFIAVAGHMFSPYIGFKGGKGVATFAGSVFAITPLVLVLALVVFAVVVVASKYVSLGSIIAVISYPLLVLLFKPGQPVLLIFGICAVLVILISHRENIVRLVKKEEKRISVGKPSKNKGE